MLFGLALSRTALTTGPLLGTLERLGAVFFDIINLVMVASPLAAFGAMAFAVGQYGLASLWALGKLLAVVYLAMVGFVTCVLGPICRLYGFSLWRLLRLIRKELALVFATSSSESALPALMGRLTQAGCQKSVVGFVVPTGYSFNLDGTSLYLSTAVLFLAQAAGVELSWQQIFGILGILLLTSKGAAGVTGAGFVTLAATLSALPGEPIPVESLVLLVGIDRFMSAARALTNLVGNSVATVVIAKSHGLYEDRGLL
jgi:aerobic C4-dicarboxylate transport protein